MKKALINKFELYMDKNIEDFTDKDWYKVSFSSGLPEELLEHFSHKIDWDALSSRGNLTDQFIINNESKINFPLLSVSQNLSEEILLQYAAEIGPVMIPLTQKLTEDFIKNNLPLLDISVVIKNQVLSNELLNALSGNFDKDKLILQKEIINLEKTMGKDILDFTQRDWNELSRWTDLPDIIIDEFSHLIDWVAMSGRGNLSENIIEKFPDKVNWINLSINQKLSDELIERNKSRFEWNILTDNQNFSEEFIFRNIARFVPKFLDSQNNISFEFFMDNISSFDVVGFYKNNPLTNWTEEQKDSLGDIVRYKTMF